VLLWLTEHRKLKTENLVLFVLLLLCGEDQQLQIVIGIAAAGIVVAIVCDLEHREATSSDFLDRLARVPSDLLIEFLLRHDFVGSKKEATGTMTERSHKT